MGMYVILWFLLELRYMMYGKFLLLIGHTLTVPEFCPQFTVDQANRVSFDGW